MVGVRVGQRVGVRFVPVVLVGLSEGIVVEVWLAARGVGVAWLVEFPGSCVTVDDIDGKSAGLPIEVEVGIFS